MKEIISKKDKRILAELDIDSRQTDSSIAKKTGLSKQVVNYRISNLISGGIITDFYTILDTAKLGFNSYYVFLQLEKIDKTREEAIVAQLSALHFVGWLISGVGKWDIGLMIFANSMMQFDAHLNKVVNLCHQNLHNYDFTISLSAQQKGYMFIESKKDTGVKLEETKEKIILDKTDLQILLKLAPDARISLTEIQKKTKIPIHTSIYRIKAMEKSKVILGYKPKLDIAKLGYEWHLLLLKFQNISDKRRNEFLYFCEGHENIYYITRTIGLYSLMLDVHVKTNDDIRKLIQELRDKFSDVVKLYESIVVFKEHKISYFPQELVDG